MNNVFKDQPPPSEAELRNSQTEYISKKPKLSPNFEKKFTSIKPTILKEKVTDGEIGQKNTQNFNKLMISKFENDLENLLNSLTEKCQKGPNDKLDKNDPDLIKLFNIINEFEKHFFNGPELINSNLGKLFKTIHFLLIQNKSKLNILVPPYIFPLTTILPNRGKQL